MKAPHQRFTTLVATALLIGLSGCATVSKEEFNQVMDMAKQAQQEATAARQAASAAQRTADDAKRSASAAQSAASAAQASAAEANSCCTANSQKIERMFQESMRK